MGFFKNLFKKRRKNDELPHAYNEQITPSEPESTVNGNLNAATEKKHTKTEIKKQENPSATKTNKKKSSSAKTRSVKNASYKKGKFEIKSTKDGRYVFNLYSSNRSIIATSQIYSSAKSALIGINSVIANAEIAGIEDTTLVEAEAFPYPKWEIYIDKANRFRFRLNASNGNCICHSRGYSSKASCKKCIESVIKTVKTATVEKAYLNANND